MGDRPSCLLVCVLLVALLGLGLACLSLGWRIYDELLGGAATRARLDHLEQELGHLESLRSVMLSPPGLCSLLPDPGPCRGEVQRWYFLSRESDCVQFPWGGCQGNGNNFLTRAQCRSACRVPGRGELSYDPTASPLPTPSPIQDLAAITKRRNFSPGDCLLPPQAGPCRDRITRYYHEAGHCRRFQYGGCSGNDNNFFSVAECERHCASPEEEEEEVMVKEASSSTARNRRRERAGARRRVDSCSLAPSPGTCSSRLQRFWWDGLAGVCRAFQWTGCGGNSNNFGSLEKCLQRCGGISR